MISIGIWFIFLAVVIHVYIWVLESFLWTKPKTTKLFGISHKDAVVSKQLAFNQGFYNLFLAIMTAIGAFTFLVGHVDVGYALLVAGTGSMIFAGLLLLLTDRTKRRAALVQFVAPAIGIVLIALG
ncbi:MAG TPA: DUF1304 domain-containing protein [Candidatus Microsaccharimonas sp.]|jgi:putative membrane protein